MDEKVREVLNPEMRVHDWKPYLINWVEGRACRRASGEMRWSIVGMVLWQVEKV